MYYFAYGSNMELSHIRRLCGWGCRMRGRATLPGFEIGLDKRGYANIRPKAGEKVLGILYDIDEKSLQALDEFEGCPEIFGRQQARVHEESGQALEAWVYVETADQFGGNNPNLNYWQRVIAAAREHKLPGEWIKKLESFLRGKAVF